MLRLAEGGYVGYSAEDLIRFAYTLFDWTAVSIIVVGLGVALVLAGRRLFRREPHAAYTSMRTTFGRSILLGLELFVAADLVRTMAFQPTLQNLSVLAVLIALRTLLAWALELEIDGRWPWQRAKDAPT
jgi:uncharacterized membrane protein